MKTTIFTDLKIYNYVFNDIFKKDLYDVVIFYFDIVTYNIA